MELDNIEPMALGIEQAQLRRIFVGEARLFEHGCRFSSGTMRAKRMAQILSMLEKETKFH